MTDATLLGRSRIALLAAVLVVVPLVHVVGTATPAQASHDWIWGHWFQTGASGQPAPGIHDRNNTYRNTRYGGQNAFGYGASFWNGRTYGTVGTHLASVGGDPWDCSLIPWAIVVCAGFAGNDQYGRPNLAAATPYYFDSQLHIYAWVVRVNPNAAFSDGSFMNVGAHEVGHTIGLGHRGGASVMNTVEANRDRIAGTDDHDIQAVRNMYQWPHH